MAKLPEVELISIESVLWPPGELGQPKPVSCWKVTLGSRSVYGEHALTARFYFEKQYWTGDGVLPVAKSYFHNLTKDLGGVTEGWNLDDSQRNALRRPQPKPPSDNPA
jgi:hypothetical protein